MSAHFAYPLSWWALVLLVAVAALAGAATYGIGPRGAPRRGRILLAGLRAAALLLLMLVLFRPLVLADQRNPHGTIVPILVDESRSMRIADADGRRRIDRAGDLLSRTLLPGLSGRFEPQVFTFGDVLAAASGDHLPAPDERRTDLNAALAAVRERFRDRPIAAIVVLSDGGATDQGSPATPAPAPVFAIGVGGEPPDREVTSLTAAVDSTLAASLVELDATVVSRGFGSQPFDVRLVAHRAGGPASPGTTVDARRVTATDGVPFHVRFPVAPQANPVVYTVEAPADPREAVSENNVASVLLTPPGRKRRILFVEGAPGFEHGFLRRAWGTDPAIEIDSVVRKGRNEQGQDAFLVQADGARAPALMSGYPTTRAALFTYDAIVFGNVEWDFLTRDQLAMTADFVRERGGGVLVLGARSFASPGLAGSALADALPLTPLSGRSPVSLTAATPPPAAVGTSGKAAADENKLRLTGDGRDHAIMRVVASADDNERQWNGMPALASVNALGAAKAGASVLAVAVVDGSTRPVVALQRYGRGRALEFAGEGSWRWKMLLPAPDRTHELFWRQAVRWLSAEAPDPVTIAPVERAQPGVAARVDVLVADSDYHPATGAVVSLRITGPDGQTRTADAALADQAAGRYSAQVKIDRPGAYRIEADARQGSRVLGAGARTFLAGATDPEFADPRLNETLLQRLAADSGGRYVEAGDARDLPDMLRRSAEAVTVAAQPRDVWQHPLVFGAILTLLGAEWVLRRRRGMA